MCQVENSREASRDLIYGPTHKGIYGPKPLLGSFVHSHNSHRDRSTQTKFKRLSAHNSRVHMSKQGMIQRTKHCQVQVYKGRVHKGSKHKCKGSNIYTVHTSNTPNYLLHAHLLLYFLCDGPRYMDGGVGSKRRAQSWGDMKLQRPNHMKLQGHGFNAWNGKLHGLHLWRLIMAMHSKLRR